MFVYRCSSCSATRWCSDFRSRRNSVAYTASRVSAWRKANSSADSSTMSWAATICLICCTSSGSFIVVNPCSSLKSKRRPTTAASESVACAASLSCSMRRPTAS